MSKEFLYCGFCHGKNNLCRTSENFSKISDEIKRRIPLKEDIISDISSNHTSNRHEDTSIKSLPDTVLLHIFSFLPVQLLYDLRKVNKRWKSVSEDNVLWQSLNLSCQNVNATFIKEVISLPNYLLNKIKVVNLMWSTITNLAFQILCKCVSQQTILLLRNSHLSESEMDEKGSFSTTKSLEIADLRHVRGRWSKLLHNILSFTNLRCLAISDNLTSDFLDRLSNVNLKNLHVLKITGNTSITDDIVTSILTRAQNLQSLSLHSCMSIQGKYLLHLKDLKNLKYLDINSSRYIDAYLSMTDWRNLNLEALDISFCCPMQEENLKAIVTNILNLKQLNISFVGWGRSFSDDVIKEMINKNDLILSLESLDMHSTFNITICGFELLLSACPRLKHLRIGSLIRTTKELQLICNKLPNIENLSLQLANAFFDASILFDILSRYCTKLKTLFVFNIRFEFTEEFEKSFARFLEGCKSIRNIFVGSYPYTEKEAIDKIIKRVAKKYSRSINTNKPYPAIPAHELSFDAFLCSNFKARNYHSEELKHSLKRNLNCQSFYLSGLTSAHIARNHV